MRLHRFIKNLDLSNRTILVEDVDLINQVKNVFRLKSGDKIILADGKGNEAICEIKSRGRNELELGVLEVSHSLISRDLPALYCSVLKKENFEFVVQKAVECGIGKIVPIITDRTIKLNLNLERLEKIAKEAAEQSGRPDVPEIYSPVGLEDAMKSCGDGLNMFFEKSGEPVSKILKRGSKEISAWIGPEGGWSKGELELARSHGFKIASLGKTTLRGETAAIVASYLISNT